MNISKIYKLYVYALEEKADFDVRGCTYCDRHTVGYFDSMPEAINQIQLTSKCKYLLFNTPVLFTIEAMNLNVNRLIGGVDDLEEISSYDSQGKYITTVMNGFNGRLEGEIKHKQGDIVFVVDDDYSYYGIIGYPPISTSEVIARNIQYLDMGDDSYVVYLIGEGDTHTHVLSTHILPVDESTVDPVFVKKLKEKLQERLAINNKSAKEQVKLI